MSVYLLLRDHIQSGPFSLEELKVAGIRSTDLLWINGKSTAWRYPDEIEELQAFVHASAINMNNGDIPNTTLQIQHEESSESIFLSNGNGDTLSYKSKEVKIQPIEIRNEEREDYEEERPDTGITLAPFTNKYPGIRKSNISREDPSDSLPVQDPENENKEDKPDSPPQPHIITVIIADDHTLFREGVKMALAHKKDIKIVGEAENGVQLLNLLKHNLPDVILLDILMPIMDGISALTSIRKYYGDIKVIMLSMYNDHSMVSTLMGTGANAYLTKSADSESIYQAIKTCYINSYYFNELTNVSMLEKLRSDKNIPNKPEALKFEGINPALKMPELQERHDQAEAGSKKISKQLIIATLSILLITSGILAGITFLSHSSQKSIALPQSPKKDEIIPAKAQPSPDAGHPSQPVEPAMKINPVNSPLPEKPGGDLKVTKSASEVKPGGDLNVKKSASEVKPGGDLKVTKNAPKEKPGGDLNVTKNAPKEKPGGDLNVTKSASKEKPGGDLNVTKSASEEKTNPEPGDKNQNLVKATAIPVTVSNNSNENPPNVNSGKKNISAAADKKAHTRSHLKYLVTVFANNYKVESPGEGLSNIELTVYNQTFYKLDQVTVEVKYRLSDNSLYKTEIINLKDIAPLSSKLVIAPNSSKGVKVEYHITSVRSKELDL